MLRPQVGRVFSSLGACSSSPVQVQLCAARSQTLKRFISIAADYAHAARKSSFARVTDADKVAFQQMLSEGQVLTDPSEVAAYSRDWMGKYEGQGSVVLRPRDTKQVSAVLQYCNSRKLAVVPQGGNTGLVGGSVPVHDEVVLSTSLMNRVERFDETSGILISQAGCILESLDHYVAKFGYMMPVDLGAKGSCQIGGNVSTCAGGLRLLRYGSLHGNVLGLEVVLANGTIVDALSVSRKDNTGTDIKQLFIGSEGTLGVVTKVAILTPPRPKSVKLAYFGLNSFEDVQKLLARAKSQLGEILSAFEFEDRDSVRSVLSHFKNARSPVGSDHPFYVLIETSGSNADHDQEKLDAFLEGAMADSLVSDGTVSQDSKQSAEIWWLRERVVESMVHDGRMYAYDVSLPLDQYYQLVLALRERLAGKYLKCLGYGHVGDGNIHIHVTAPLDKPCIQNDIEPFIFEFVAKYRGSISAEHGLGVNKAHLIGYSKSAESVGVMKALKQTLDPNGILNPYKMMVA